MRVWKESLEGESGAESGERRVCEEKPRRDVRDVEASGSNMSTSQKRMRTPLTPREPVGPVASALTIMMRSSREPPLPVSCISASSRSVSVCRAASTQKGGTEMRTLRTLFMCSVIGRPGGAVPADGLLSNLFTFRQLGATRAPRKGP